MSINPVDIVIHVLNIGVLYVILRFLVYKPVQAFMQKRRDAIDRQFSEAAEKERAAEALHAQYTESMENARREAEASSLAEMKRAHAEAEKVLADADARAKQLLQEAREKAKAENAEKLATMENDVKDIAIDIAQKILAREVSTDDNIRIVDQFFKRGIGE